MATFRGFVGLAAIAAFAGCSDSKNNPTPDGGVTADAPPSCSTGTVSGNGIIKDFCPPTEPGARGVFLTASGETLANSGYAFPPLNADDVYFVDGWEVRYTRVIVTFDHVTLAENPDLDPGDESKTGAVVAGVDGPWAVDLHKGGPLPDKDGNAGAAVAIAALTGKNRGGATGAFDTTMRYAFSFDGVPATASALNVNLDAAGLTDYQDMIANEYTALFVGTATYKGGVACNATSTISSYDFTKLPPVVNFRFGFKAPASYINAQNPDNEPADHFNGEEHQRGIKITANADTIAQVTFHLDHVFWESTIHDSPAHFDQFAANYVGQAGVPTAKMEDFIGLGFTPVKDKNAVVVPWRWCVNVPDNAPTLGLSFDTEGRDVNPQGSPTTSLRDLYDYVRFNHSTWGHLNADGLSFVQRHYDSPR